MHGRPARSASRRILLADCDQMFVAVARLVDPEGAGRARLLVVGGRPNSRGVVCSASYEARAFGVRSGMPLSQAARRCPAAHFVPVPRAACSAKSREVRAVLAEWSPRVESASIDEFYLDLSGTESVYRGETLAVTAARIRSAVLERTGLTVSIGGGTNRLVAKMAAERAKPRSGSGGQGVLIVEPGAEGAFLAEHALADIPGIGPRLDQALRRRGLITVRDALAVERGDLERWLGPATGAWLHARIRGEAGNEVDAGSGARSMSRETTFARDLSTDRAIETELLRLVTRLAADLRAAGLTARTVTVKLRDHDFRTRQAARTLDEPVRADRAVFSVARALLQALRGARRVPGRLIGVSLSRLAARGEIGGQLELDGTAPGVESAQDRALARLVDRVNTRFGRQALEPARLKGRPRAT